MQVRARRCGPWFRKLGLTFGGLLSKSKIKEYRRISVQSGRRFCNEQVNTVNFLFCHEDDAEGSRIKAGHGHDI